MKIISVESFTRGHVAVVRVRTECGMEGYGQVAPYNPDISAMVLHRQIAPIALGRDPLEIEEIVQTCIEKNYKFTGSYVCRALSGLETALWDIKGKYLGKSVCEILGGKPRAIEIYGSSMLRTIRPDEEAARIAELRNIKGIKAFKVRIGKAMGHNQDEWPGRTEDILVEFRRVLGNTTELYVDANGCYTPEQAIDTGKVLKEYGVAHYEEPCPYWEYEWTKQVADALDIPVAAGEQESLMQVWRRLIALKAVDIVQPDICYLGGISRTLEVAEKAEKAGLIFMPHAANRSMLAVFTLHMAGAVPNTSKYTEFSIEPDPWFEGIYEPVLEVRDGKVMIPDGPGWGITVDRDWLGKAEHKISNSTN